MTLNYSVLFKNLVEIEVKRQFPQKKKGRPTSITFDDAYNSIFLLVRTGMQWRHLSPQTASYITVFKTMHKWIHNEVFKIAYTRLLKLYNRKRHPKYYCIDSSFVKNMYGRDCLGRNPTDRGRKASKLSVVVDDKGIPFSFYASQANISDMRLLTPTINSMLYTAERNRELYADKGYDSAANRISCRALGFRDRIMKRRCRIGHRTNGKRVVVENFFAWHDKYRRLILRYEQKVTVYVALSIFAAGILLGKRMERTISFWN